MKHATKVVLALSALIAALALSACGGDDDDSTTTTSSQDKQQTQGRQSAAPEKKAGGEATPTIVIRDGEPVGGVKQLDYSAGEQIRFKVESDVAEEVHFHGYEVMKEVKAGGSVTFDQPAEIEGIFEVELEGLGEQIAEITVNP